ncbi:molybdopterin guanine dinucleotide-containing S/N-oxide reductase [Propylenella binzhouense]|uniref:Asp-tRNA(Asn)/Glu-tRNA(Gln) amidotransferase GatCAB subunit C n=1 Tax=Propylenella binzhouense TaxID=2555902 RepID=A0A964T673_9HYPH|nr:molybdopterin guanine dinucleotide-containing S/N-oxide reductase [Propylenella binzhouense]MYZ48147.1 Asp-tRNA(Asn)/Glu-tRNA(Gln) amidotransferase GatCAB subunit C [Propylenella binzhouense]
MPGPSTSISLSHWGAFLADTEDGRLVGVRPFPRDPAPSPIIENTVEMVYSPLRVAEPAIRESVLRSGPGAATERRGSDPFVSVGWDQALDFVAAELRRIRGEHGPGGIFGGSYGWSSAGRFHHARSQLRRFLFAGGGCVDQVTNYSWGAAQVLLPHVVGTHQPVSGRNTSWDSIARHTDLFVAFGGLNPKNWNVTAGGPGEHMMPHWTRRARESGVEFVVVSPVRSDIPDWLGAEWIPPRPNTDTALMLGIAHVLITEHLVDAAFLDRYTTGYDRLRAYVLGEENGVATTPDWAAEISGVEAGAIRSLARRMASGRTFIAGSWSLQRADHGEQPYWMIVALAALLGQIGLPGGGYGFGYGSLNGVGNPSRALPAPQFPTGRNPAGLAIPVARVADMLLGPGETCEFDGRTLIYPDIRMVYWAGGNPFHHHQDLNRLLRAWRRPETIVVHDTWWTPVARFADVVLPATTTLERNDLGGSSRDRFLFAMPQAIAPVGAARSDFAIFCDLAARLGYEASFTEGLREMDWVRRLYAAVTEAASAKGVAMPDFDAFWHAGYWEAPPPETEEILHADFRADPLAAPLATPSGRIELYSERIASFGYADCPPHPAWLEPAEWLGSPKAGRFPLHLISSQPGTKLHSQSDPSALSRARKVGGREPVLIHPADAERRGIRTGSPVRLFNDRGACVAAARVTAEVRPGVVVLQTGAWFDPSEPGQAGGLERHGNPNVLTLDKGTSRLAQGCSAMTALVEIEPLQDAPEVKAFAPVALKRAVPA